MEKVRVLKNTNQLSTTPKKFLKVSLALFIFSFLLQLFVSSKYAVKNVDLQALSKEKNKISKEVAQLEYENSLLSSLERVETEALSLGFISMNSRVLTISPPKLASLKAN
ncbi:MAG TPA: hypothetical protein PLT50_00860 [bacterium]|nr:hypothetical protein [bacterium]